MLFASVRTPCYVVDEAMLARNGKILKSVSDNTGCKILLAQKAFSAYDFYPLLEPYVCGTEASGLYEARLGREEMPRGEVHVFCAAYREDEMDEIAEYADHIVFNSPAQLIKFAPAVKQRGKSAGLRVNPELSTQSDHAIYDPCAEGSRLGTTRTQLDVALRDCPELLSLIDGLHFHTLCEQNSDALDVTFAAVERKFGDILPQMKWLNMGGGHHITRADYDIPRLESVIARARDNCGVTVYLEPGEACALNAGYLVTRVLDVVKNGDTVIAITDTSAACHAPDVLEMPYLPPLLGCGQAERETEGGVRVRLGGPTCLAGDVTGDYYFPEVPRVGDLLVFGDMAIYTMCKNNTFNGMPLPAIYALTVGGELKPIKAFGYNDFKGRLGG